MKKSKKNQRFIEVTITPNGKAQTLDLKPQDQQKIILELLETAKKILPTVSSQANTPAISADTDQIPSYKDLSLEDNVLLINTLHNKNFRYQHRKNNQPKKIKFKKSIPAITPASPVVESYSSNGLKSSLFSSTFFVRKWAIRGSCGLAD